MSPNGINSSERRGLLILLILLLLASLVIYCKRETEVSPAPSLRETAVPAQIVTRADSDTVRRKPHKRKRNLRRDRRQSPSAGPVRDPLDDKVN